MAISTSRCLAKPSGRIIAAATIMLWLGVQMPATARPNNDDLPWGRGTLVPSLGLGGSFGGSIGQLAISLGASYFVANGLGIGLTLSDQIWFYSASIKQTYPGINDQLPTNEFSLRPNIQYVFFRNRYFSPYALAGVGPVFLNHGGGTLGEWHAGPGFLIGFGGPVFLNLGVVFTGRFPSASCESAYTYRGPDSAVFFDQCSFGWGIRGGLVFALGMRKKSQPPPPPAPRYQPAEPAPSYAEPAPYAEPAQPPPATQPPAAQPPATQPPPAEQPPATQPPATQPPQPESSASPDPTGAGVPSPAPEGSPDASTQPPATSVPAPPQ